MAPPRVEKLPMLKVTDIRVPVSAGEDALPDALGRALRLPRADLGIRRIVRKSLDIRDKSRLEYVYTVAVCLENEEKLLARGDRRILPYQPILYQPPEPGSGLEQGSPARWLRERPIIVGSGPAGLMAGVTLAEMGYQPLLLERGQPVHQRVRDVESFDNGGIFDPESNYLFGEGGAGTFSDGKLTCRNTGPDTERVLEVFAECKGKPSILYEARPHLGSNRLPAVVKAMRQRIEQHGGSVRFGCRVEDILMESGQVRGVRTTSGAESAEVVILATGHSARDVYTMLLARGVPMVARPFQMGVRIEQPQETVTRVQYGITPAARLLGPADYTLKVTVGTQELFTFCMCAGGYVMPSVSQPGYFCTNGMSRSKHESPFANSGLVVTVTPPGNDPLSGIRLQEQVESAAYQLSGGNYDVPIQWARDFLSGQTTRDRPPSSYQRGLCATNLASFLPADLLPLLRRGLPMMDQRWNGAFLRDATLVGPEARGSCPVRLERDDLTRQSPAVAGLYPVGEGAGYAGGIVSAAVDGLRTANAIIRAYHPLQ